MRCKAASTSAMTARRSVSEARIARSLSSSFAMRPSRVAIWVSKVRTRAAASISASLSLLRSFPIASISALRRVSTSAALRCSSRRICSSRLAF
jgi:hypothetical protein